MKKVLNSTTGVAALAVVAMAGFGSQASAQDAVSGSFGYNYNSHFISYGVDVWGQGDELYGDEATNSVFGSLSWAVAEPLTITAGFWTDINDNAAPSIGGDLQEVDIYVGASYAVGKFTLGATYQEWKYASDVEKIFDVSVSFDDTGLLPIKLSPTITYHDRLDGNGAQTEGAALVGSIRPSFDLGFASLAIPVGVAYFIDEDFQGGDDSYGYSYAGGSFAVPMTFIPEDLGAWSLTLDLIYYSTNEDAIPGNPEENFLTSSIGFVTSF